MVKSSGKGKRQTLSGPRRDRLLAEEEAARKYRKHLQAIKDKLDLYGEDALTPEDTAFVKKHHDFFYPEEG